MVPYQPNTRVPPYNVRVQLPTAAPPVWHLGSRLHTSPLVLPIASIAGSGRLAIEMEAAGAAPEVRERCCRATEDFVQFWGEGAAYPLSLLSTSACVVALCTPCQSCAGYVVEGTGLRGPQIAGALAFCVGCFTTLSCRCCYCPHLPNPTSPP